MNFFEPQPGDEVKSNGVIIRTCSNGSKMYIDIGHKLDGMFEEDHKKIFEELEAELTIPLPSDYVSKGEWWD